MSEQAHPELQQSNLGDGVRGMYTNRDRYTWENYIYPGMAIVYIRPAADCVANNRAHNNRIRNCGGLLLIQHY